MQKCWLNKINFLNEEEWTKFLKWCDDENKKIKIKGVASTRRVVVKLSRKERKMVYDVYGIYWPKSSF